LGKERVQKRNWRKNPTFLGRIKSSGNFGTPFKEVLLWRKGGSHKELGGKLKKKRRIVNPKEGIRTFLKGSVQGWKEVRE